MTQDDVLFGYRLQLFALAAERGVSEACRLMGVNRSTYYRWKPEVERAGLEMLRPRERGRPRMPNQLSMLVEQKIVAFALGHPGLGPRRIASRLARPEWGGLIVSANGVYKVLVRHGLNTRAKRLALVAGYRAPYEPPREPPSEQEVINEISREILRIHEESYGKGAGKAITFLVENFVTVVLDDPELLPNEKFLIDNGKHDTVMQVRTQYQHAIQASFRAAIERAIGRKVIGFASTTSVDEPRFVAEIFKLE